MACSAASTFGISSTARHPSLVTHELTYGRLQRRYCREWFAYLSAEDIQLSPEQLDGAIDDTAGWKKPLVAALGEQLWSKVKRNEMCSPGAHLDPKEV
jgi:hypothetical protein